ncbi:hypothetical protein [Mycolicibacterium vulneris]|jgi:hypothetical protein|nr:hypothetical protein [Mycolicibacterium vulneris]
MVFLYLLLGTRYLMPLGCPRRPAAPGFAALAIAADLRRVQRKGLYFE